MPCHLQGTVRTCAVAALATTLAIGCREDEAAPPAAGDAGAGADVSAPPSGDDAGPPTADAAREASAPTQLVGGTVAGLTAGSVVLQNNGGDDVTVSKNGSFTFATPLAPGATYDVKVKAQPSGQQCTVTSGSGTVSTTDVTNVVVACDDTLSCPAGTTASKQTICGRLYDLADDAPFQADAACTPCPVTPTATGPCSLRITAYDAAAFSADPAAAPPLAAAESFLDTCGRYRVADVTLPSGPTIVLAVDDATAAGPTGNTVTVAVATPAAGGTATRNREAWIATPATVQAWQNSGGPALSGGVYVPIFRAHMDKPAFDRFMNQDGVTVTRAGSEIAAQDHYFTAAGSVRSTIDPAASATGVNGAALVTGAALTEGSAYSGKNGLADTSNCRWETRAAASIPSVVFVQTFRPTDQVGKTCPL